MIARRKTEETERPGARSKTSPEQAARAEAAGLLARAKTDELKAALTALAAEESVTGLKGPETGLVMLRGRIGGGGAAFNLGEATMSRASVRLSDGLVGHGQCLGTDRDKARLIAILDALFQRPGLAGPIETQLLAPVRKRVAAEAETRAEETAATRVDFFTMVRGDN